MLTRLNFQARDIAGKPHNFISDGGFPAIYTLLSSVVCGGGGGVALEAVIYAVLVIAMWVHIALSACIYRNRS